jgi:hypothetical protein
MQFLTSVAMMYIDGSVLIAYMHMYEREIETLTDTYTRTHTHTHTHENNCHSIRQTPEDSTWHLVDLVLL